MTARLAERGATVAAADLAPRMVELARARTGDVVEWHEADAQDLSFTDGAFDAVLPALGIIFAPRNGARRPAGVHGVGPGGVHGRDDRGHAPLVAHPADIADVLDRGRAPVVESWVRAAEFADVTLTRAALPWHVDSPTATTAFLLGHAPMHQAAAGGLGERAGEMFAAVEQIAGSAGEPVRPEAGYVLIVAH